MNAFKKYIKFEQIARFILEYNMRATIYLDLRHLLQQ